MAAAGRENDAFSKYKPVCLKEYGFMPVHVYEPDPLFEGLGEDPVFWEAHYVEAKQLPKGFAAFASTAECRIQAIKREEKLVYGVQFHPECYDAEHTDGRDLLVNFFRLAGIRR
jgi:GMP synthase (glutamine-hydrolysing)